MNTSSRFVVATHILAALAARRIGFGRHVPVKSDVLAVSVNTNAVVIRRILGRLRDAGLVFSQKGPNGGAMLTRNPRDITLLQIFEAVEDGNLFHLHYCTPSEFCPIGKNIQTTLRATLEQAENAMKNILSSKTLLEIAQDILSRSGIQDMLASGKSPEEVHKVLVGQMPEEVRVVVNV